jgi:hypothetical protein
MEVVPWSDSCLPCYRHMSPYPNRHQHLTPDRVRFDSSDLGNGLAEIVAYGTAATVRPA